MYSMVIEMDLVKSGITPVKTVSWAGLLFHSKDCENGVPNQNLPRVWTANPPSYFRDSRGG